MRTVPEMIVEVVSAMHVSMVEEEFGSVGLDAMYEIMSIIKTIFRHVEPDRVNGKIVIYKKVVDNISTPPPIEPAADFVGLANQVIEDLYFEIASNGRAYRRTDIEALQADLPQSAV